jgi:hypothetical protein
MPLHRALRRFEQRTVVDAFNAYPERFNAEHAVVTLKPVPACFPVMNIDALKAPMDVQDGVKLFLRTK